MVFDISLLKHAEFFVVDSSFEELFLPIFTLWLDSLLHQFFNVKSVFLFQITGWLSFLKKIIGLCEEKHAFLAHFLLPCSLGLLQTIHDN